MRNKYIYAVSRKKPVILLNEFPPWQRVCYTEWAKK